MSASKSITVGSAGWESHGQVLNDMPGSKKGEQCEGSGEIGQVTERGGQSQGSGSRWRGEERLENQLRRRTG